jgi:hypothetical protein
LREFARPKAVARQRFTAPITSASVSREESTDELLAKLIEARIRVSASRMFDLAARESVLWRKCTLAA